METPRAIIFDLDNTLAEPFTAPRPDMAQKFEALLGLMPLAVMSAASFERMQQTLLSSLSPSLDYSKLLLFTANAAQCFHCTEGEWKSLYEFAFNDEQRARIHTALEEAVQATGTLSDHTIYSEQFIDYKGYLAFTALGLGAPEEERKRWDPNQKKRQAIRSILIEKLPEFDVYIGGLTTIDITLKGINKAYGVRWYAEHLGLSPADMLYVGDALYEGGNDAVVEETGIQTRKVAGPSETTVVLDELLAK